MQQWWAINLSAVWQIDWLFSIKLQQRGPYCGCEHLIFMALADEESVMKDSLNTTKRPLVKMAL